MAKRYLVTGGAGFIGSNYIRYLLGRYPDCSIVNLDKLTYAGNLDNLAGLDRDPRYSFVEGDICDSDTVDRIVSSGVDYLVNFAAETHVDRSIIDPAAFIRTDVMGTHVLLESVRKFGLERYIQISTDEVYGSIEEGAFREWDPVTPSSPYSASKAGAELLVQAYITTYGIPAIITRASNNFGPYQYPEKLIPLFVTHALDDRPLPLYGDGLNVRDWLYVEDHCSALDLICRDGALSEIYNIGGGNERTNIDITHRILRILGKPDSLIQPIKDRPGHDRRYAVDTTRIRALGWKPAHDFETGLEATVAWYRDNREWWMKLKERNRKFNEYYQNWYQHHLGMAE
ncbi:dTDP-glucose 4,6-dehydratase [bacterium]|nr:dTDP-glucose 4,6-dehydratase [candidate division CSSED10-310 bacterium]